MIWEGLKIFLIGVLEDFLSSFNTKTIQRNNEFFSFTISFVSVILWYYVIVMVVENLQQFWLILVYACGGGFGDIVTIRFDSQITRFERGITTVLSMVRFRWPVEFVRKRRLRFSRQGERRRNKRGFWNWLKNLFNRNHKYTRKAIRRIKRQKTR